MSYQGHKNYQTWAFKLWIDNDEGLYIDCLERTERYKDDVYALTSALNDLATEYMPEAVGFYSDLLNHAISEIDFYEVATSLLETYKGRS